LHSGTRFLEGFKRHSQKPPSDLFSSLNASASARAEIGRFPCGGRSLSRAENLLPATSFELRAIGFPARSQLVARSLAPPEVESPQLVQKLWKSCDSFGLTAARRDDSFKRFRGQTDSHSCDLFWTESAPLRRKADRSLTNRLNVPVK